MDPEDGHSLQWSPPAAPWRKINVDEVVKNDYYFGGIRCIVRNSKGKIIAALHKKLSPVGDVEQAEAMAILEGVKLGTRIKAKKFIIESDALNVISLCKGVLSSRKEIAWTIAEINRFILNPEHVVFHFVPRIRNSAAHQLANLGLKSSQDQVWVDEVPIFLENL